MSQTIQEIIHQVDMAGKVLITGHIYPDCDALGSQLALGMALEAMGKQVCYFAESEVAGMYRFLPGWEKLADKLPDPGSVDLAIAVDCGDLSRLGKNGEKFAQIHPLIVIDHHVGHKVFGDINWIDPTCGATGEMIYSLLQGIGVEISYEMAYCLYAAISSDTGSFKYSSTTADSFLIARDLVGKGVKPAEIAGRLFDNFTISRLSLLRKVLDTLEFYENEKIAVIVATNRMFADTGCVQADTESFINYPRSLEPVKIAVFIKQSQGNLLSVSLRSKGQSCDVAAVAAKFGGGGHRNAAGFKVSDTTIDEIRRLLLQELAIIVTVC